MIDRAVYQGLGPRCQCAESSLEYDPCNIVVECVPKLMVRKHTNVR